MADTHYKYRPTIWWAKGRAWGAARCGEVGAAFLNFFIAFPWFVWDEVLRPALRQRRLYGVLRDETRRLFCLQGIAPLQTRRSVIFVLLAWLVLILASQAAVYGLHASVEGIAAKLIAFTLFLLAIAKAVAVATGLTAWFAFRVAAAREPDRDLAMVVVRTTQPFFLTWLIAEAASWWLLLL